jgi:Amt family ammonium transporter
VCRYFSLVLKEKFGYDDSLDVFGVHGVGGFVGKYFPFTTFRRMIAHTRLTFILFLSGTCLLGIVAAPALGGFNFSTSVGQQTVIQCVAAVGTAVYTAVASYVLLLLVKKIVGGDLRVPASAEQGEGLDQYCHGEQCYTLSHGELEGGQPVDVPGWNTAVTAPEPVAT